ncbi:MAG: acyltransferase family protein, partial [Anaerotignaceae bacterium]
MKPLKEIIFANTILCLLVVFIHVSSAPVSTLDKSTIQYLMVMAPWRLSAFVVQGFIFLSSFKIFIKNKPITDYKTYYVSRFKAIVVPYFIWFCLYYIYFVNHYYFEAKIGHFLKNFLLGSLVSPFYFIVIIFQFYALLPLWQWLFKKVGTVKILLLSLAITIVLGHFVTIPYRDRIFTTYIFYWILGGVVALNYEKIKEVLSKKWLIISFIFIVVAVLDVYTYYENSVMGNYLWYIELLHICYCVAGISFVIAMGIKLPLFKAVGAINTITFPIYLSHCYAMLYVNDFIVEKSIHGIAKA